MRSTASSDAPPGHQPSQWEYTGNIVVSVKICGHHVHCSTESEHGPLVLHALVGIILQPSQTEMTPYNVCCYHSSG